MEGVMTYAQTFFGWLLQTTLIASVVICLILLIQKMLGGKLGPRWCHALWLVLLIRMILPWVPSSRVSLLNLIPSWDRQIQRAQPSEATEQQLPSYAGQASDTAEAIPAQESESDVTIQKRIIPEPKAVADIQIESQPWLVSLRRILPVLWLAGAIVIGTYLLVSNFTLWRIVKRDSPLVNQKMLELFEECKTQMGVQSLVVVVPSSQIRSPALFGFLRPRLLLPLEMLEKTSHEEMRYVFLHELAHLRRHDIYLGWLTSLLQVLHWFNPLVWFAFYRMRADRELACDGLVLARTQKEESQEYGQAIVSLVRRFSRSRPLPAMAGIIESRSQLKRRITMITQFKKNSYQWSPLAIALIIFLAGVSLPNAVGSKKPISFWPKSEPGILLRRIKTGPMSDFSSAPSLDGRYLCDLGSRDAEGNTGLAIRDLVTGEVRPLTEASRGFPLSLVISPDSKYVAYVYKSWSPPMSELQLIRMDGTGHRVLYRLKEDEKFHIRAWTPDGKKVLGAFKKGSESLQLVAFSIEDGSMQVIYTFDTYWPVWQSPLHKVAISPDGRYIAYDRPPEKGSWNAEIYILDIEHQRTECVVQHPAYDKLLGWTPDGNYIFFSSDRRQGLPRGFTVTDSWDAYLLPVAKGRRQGAPVLIKRDIPDKIRPKGFTREGTYHYTIEFKTIEAVVAKLDLQTGKLLTKPQAVGQRGADFIPAWSPDGRYLAYCTHELDQSQTIRIRNMATSEERRLDPNLPRFSWLRWSPDGKSLLVSNFAKESPRAIYRINASTGERVTVVQSESSDTLPGEPQLSLDGSTLFYVVRHSDSKKTSLITRDIESGREEELFSMDSTRDIRQLSFALSPDGQQLAALATMGKRSSRGVTVRRILTMPAKGGEFRELWKTEGRVTRPMIAWTPDGQSLLFTKQSSERGRELWLIPAGGGQARKLCGPQEMMCQGMMFGVVHSALDMHPDGQRIAFDCFEYRHEVWAMENFLPAAPVAKTASQITLRQIWSGPDADAYGGPSADGRYLSHTDWKTGDLAIRELATGKTRILTETKKGGREKFFRFALNSVISPDGMLIAYSWTNQYGTYDLCVIAADGSGDRTLYSRKDHEIYPASWSSDGKRIAARRYTSNMEIVSVLVADGSVQVLKTSEQFFWPQFCYSPDDRFIACDFPVAENAENYDISLIRADGSGEIPLVTHPANDRLLGWVPSRDEVLFRSNRSGTHDIWAVRVVDGKVQDSPRPVTRDVGEISPQGFTRDGSFYFSRYKRRFTSQTIPLNERTGEVQEQLAKPLLGSNYSPAWSPDGRYLAYVQEQTATAGPGWYHRPLHIRDVKTGEERTLAEEFGLRSPRWSPDGRSLLVIGKERKKDYNGGVYTIDVQDGRVTELVQFPPVEKWSRDIWSRSIAEWAHDGKAIFYTSRGKIIRRQIKSGQETQLYQSDNLTRALDVSPDGKTLVFGNGLSSEGQGQVMSMSVSGGQPTELCRFQEPKGGLKTPRQLAWTPDGNYVLFAKKEEKGATVRRVSSSGGEPEVIGALKDSVTDLSIHPNGDEIAISTYMQEHAIWVMENFLPEDHGK